MNRPAPILTNVRQVGAARDLAFALKKSLGRLTDPLTPQYEREQIATFLQRAGRGGPQPETRAGRVAREPAGTPMGKLKQAAEKEDAKLGAAHRSRDPDRRCPRPDPGLPKSLEHPGRS